MKIAIIGGGHNGLVAACYLGQEGHHVDVYERRSTLGGLCVSEPLFPGCRVCSLAGRYGMLRPKIIKDLNLTDHGLQAFQAPYSSHFLSNGDAITLCEETRNKKQLYVNIDQLSSQNEQAWSLFWRDITGASQILSDMFDSEDISLSHFQTRLCEAQLKHVADSILTEDTITFCKRYDLNKSQIAIIGTMGFTHPLEVESLFQIILLGTAKAFGRVGKWGYVKGGMGTVIDALLRESRRHNIHVHLSCEVNGLTKLHNDTYRLELPGGGSGIYDKVILAVDPLTAYTQFLNTDTAAFEEAQDFEARMGYTVVHLLLNELPELPCLKASGRDHDKRFHGQIDLTPTLDEMISGYEAFNQSNTFPISSVNFHTNMLSCLDPSVSCDGKHIWKILHQYSPMDQDMDDHKRKQIKQDTIKRLSLWATNLEEIVDEYRVITPYDIAHTYGVRTLSCKHLTGSDKILDRLPWNNRPGHTSHFPNVYLSGAGTPPGPTVSGLPGYLAAKQALIE